MKWYLKTLFICFFLPFRDTRYIPINGFVYLENIRYSVFSWLTDCVPHISSNEGKMQVPVTKRNVYIQKITVKHLPVLCKPSISGTWTPSEIDINSWYKPQDRQRHTSHIAGFSTLNALWRVWTFELKQKYNLQN